MGDAGVRSDVVPFDGRSNGDVAKLLTATTSSNKENFDACV